MKMGEAGKAMCPVSMAGDKTKPCLGKDCAAWRWAEPVFGANEGRRGFCGLAGEPKYPLHSGEK